MARRGDRRTGGAIGSILDGAWQWAGERLGQSVDEYREMTTEVLAPWFQSFVGQAAPRIKGVLDQHRSCEAAHVVGGVARPCHGQAAMACEVCRRFACLPHSFVSAKGDSICWECVADALRKQPGRQNAGPHQGPPPRDSRADDKERKTDEALKTLGLDRKAKWAQVSARFRELGKETHPDAVKQSEKAAAEARFKRISEAFNYLRGIDYGQEVAA